MTHRIRGNGFDLEIKGRAGLRYTEAGRTAHFDGEMLTGEFDFVIYSSACRWEDTGEALSQAEKERLLNNIRDAFGQEGMRLDVE